MADFIVSGKERTPPSLSPISASGMQREETKPAPPKPNNYDEAVKKIVDALKETAVAKELKAKAAEMGKDFVASVDGKVIVGSALGGALAAIIATNSELPIQIPELPLDFIAPGLKAKITWEGPARNPTNAGLVLTTGGGVKFGASYSNTPASAGKPAEQKGGLSLTIPLGGSSEKKKGPSESEKFRAETAHLAGEQAKFREGLKTPAERADDKAFLDAYTRSKLSDPSNPLGLPGLKKKEESLLMRKESNESSGGRITPPIVNDVLQSPGQSLDPGTRRFMEAGFGYDFGNVRVHQDSRADASARSVSAHAYTVGEDIVFGAGRFAPSSQEGQRLIAHELAHVVQQGGTAAMVQRETYYGGGYKQFHSNLDAELTASQKKPTEWHPATPDMAATAAGSGGGEAVSSFAELLTKLEAKGKGSVTVLNLIGHSNSSVFSFGGEITKDNVKFLADASIESDALTKNAARITALRDRFAEGAKIVLYSCDAGSGQGLLDAVGAAFGVCVEGFTTQIWWCLMKQDGKADRGRVWAQNPHDVLSPDTPTDCKQFASNMSTLTHDGKSKQCAAKKAPAP